jgi:hypothetical protein
MRHASARIFSAEEKASYRAWMFGSTLDWTSMILVELRYPVEELRWFVDAVQGLCKGKEARIAHSTLAKRAQRFKNQSQAQELARRAIEKDREWSRQTKCLIFDIERPKPNEREGKDKRARTLYTDYLTPAAVWAQDAEHKIKKADELRWKKDQTYRVKKRREIVDEALTLLPKFERVEDMPGDAHPKESKPLSLSEYVQQREKILLAENCRILDRVCDGELIDAGEIEDRLAILEVHHEKTLHELEISYKSTRDVLIGLKKTRLSRAANLGEVDYEPTQKGHAGVPLEETPAPPQEQYATDSFKGHAGVPLSDSPLEGEKDPQKGHAGVPPSCPPTAERITVSEADAEEEGLMQAWALAYAEQGLPVFPVWPVFDYVCACPRGSECENKGKHPVGNLAPKGVRSATTDREQIRGWWAKIPHANIGLAMGGPLRLAALDVDPRNGGSASLCDLVEAHGDAWLDTFTHRTGGGGNHFLFRLPEGVEVVKGNQKSKLAPGLDTKTEGGYIIAPPSIHVSGRRYEVERNTFIAEAPAWLVDWLTNRPSPVVINFQEAKDRRPTPGSSKEKFYEGERNDGLFAVGVGRWRHGWSSDVIDLHAQLLEVNAARCVPALESAEVAKIAAHIAADYAHLCGVDAGRSAAT